MLTILLSVAFAQDPPSAARLCADAASGDEIDICLAVAAENPQQVDQIAAALRAHVDRAEASDRTLLGAILSLLSEDEAIAGAERLGALGDPRAVPALERAARTRELPIALAAVSAMAHYRESLDPLTRWLLDRDVRLEVRIAAANAVGQIGDDTGADLMIATLRRSTVPPVVRDALEQSVRTWFPDRASEVDDVVSRDGSAWVSAGSAVGLGQALGAAGHFGRADLAALGVATGGAAGGTAGYILAQAWPMEAADASFAVTSGAVGIAAGSLVGHAVVPWQNRSDGLWLGGAAGNVVGYSLGLGLRKRHPGTVRDVLEANLIAIAAGVAAGTAAEYAWKSPGGVWTVGPAPRVRYGQLATGLGLLAGSIGGHIVAPRIDVSSKDVLFMGLTGLYGLTAGAIAPVPRERMGLPATGLAIGVIAGASLAPIVEPGADSVVGGATGLAYGAALGAGLGMLVDAQDDTEGAVTRGFTLAGASIGLGTGAFWAYQNPEFLDPADLVFVSLVTGWAGWQSVGWNRVTDAPFHQRGWYVLLPAAVGTAGALTTPLVDVPIGYSFSGLSMGLWGTFLGTAAADLVGGPNANPLAWSLVGSDIGLVVGIAAAAPPLSAPPLVIGLADAGGVLGGSLFALSSSFVTSESDDILAASVVGTGLGLIGGAVLGSALHRSGQARNVALPHLPDLPGDWTVTPAVVRTADASAPGVQLQVSGW